MINLKQLRDDVKNKRLIQNDMNMDVASKQIGISKATLSRIEREQIPDVITLSKISKWLNVNPCKYFENEQVK
jgi:transcriptional regulator with XRE-family HTH domain